MRVSSNTEVSADPTLVASYKPGLQIFALMDLQWNFVWYKAGGTQRTLLTNAAYPYWHLGFINSNTLPGVVTSKHDRITVEWTQRPNLAVEMGDITYGSLAPDPVFYRYLYGYVEFDESYKKADGKWQTTYRIVQ